MINVHWVLLGTAIGTVGLLFYILDTIRGHTEPNRVTWLLWGLIPLIAFAAEHNSGVGLESLLTFTAGAGPLLVFLVSFVSTAAVWKIGRLDYTCGALSVTAVLVWLVTGQGDVAIFGAVIADFLAALPTLVKSWKAPETETLWAYLGAVISAVITLLTVTRWNPAQAAFPLYLACVGSVEVLFVGGRVGTRYRARFGRTLPAAPVTDAATAET
jgi:hypothetical protein